MASLRFTRVSGLTSALVFACTLSTLAACGGGGSSTPSTSSEEVSAAGPNCVFNAIDAGCASVSGTAPYVIYSSRSDGSADAAVNTDVVAVMSESLDAASINDSSMKLVRDDNVAVAGTVQYDASRPGLLFVPSAELQGGHRYTATVSASVRDATGNAMGRAYSWSFRVNGMRRDTAAQKSIQQLLDKAAFTYQIPGSIIAIRDDQGRTWTTTNGVADVVNRTPITSDMVFRVGSNTKTFVATVILQLVDAGKLSLEDPINTYLASEMASYMPAYDGNAITVRHLLNHTSGINNFTIDATWGDAFIVSPYQQYFPQQLLQIANSHAADPGAPTLGTFLYSNTNYVLLGMIIKKVSGMVYEDAVANAIVYPQGLNSVLAPRIGDPSLPSPFSRGYWEDTETGTLHDVTYRDPSTVWASGNILSNITDLARWGELLGKGTLLSTGLQDQRLQYVPMSSNLFYGLGIVKDEGANLIGHQGGMIGYTSQMYYVPDKGYTLAFFYNRTLDMHDYSAVMTWDALSVLWPTRPNVSTANRSYALSHPAGARRSGFLVEY